MAEGMEIEYIVTVTGLDEAKAAANEAKASADQASTSLEDVKASGSRVIPILTNGFRALMNTRQAVEQAKRAIDELNPMMTVSAFMNITQVASNLSGVMKALRASTAAASAAQAIMVTLAGAWWLIPLALVAGAVIYNRIQSMQTGGLVSNTGLYLLHKGEEVLPTGHVDVRKTFETTNVYSTHRSELIESKPQVRYGPIYVTFEKQPKEGENDEWIRALEDNLSRHMRRGG